MKNLHLSLTLVAALAFGLCSATAAESSEAQLIAVLKSNASQKEKADACRALAHVGSKDAVPVLAALLGDEQLSHMARYGLETLPGPAVDQALRDALATLKGRQLAGVITSLGVRRDANAVKPLTKFLQDADPDVASAAARALGDIATKDAATALEAALASGAAANQLAVCEGLFRCAEAFAKAGRAKDAASVYDRLRTLPDAAHQVRAGALRGAILARGKDGVSLLAEALRGDDWVLADAAARTAMELPGNAVTKALTDELLNRSLSADRQILVLQTLGKRADTTALPAVLAATRGGYANVCLVAIRTVAEIGDASAAPALAELACDANREISETARQSLASLPGKKVDEAVLALLANPDSKTKLVGLQLVAMRRMVSAVPALQKATTDGDPQVRAAALKYLAEFGGEPELPGLLTQLENASDVQTRAAVESALGTLCNRIGKPDVCADKLTARLAQATPATKAALLRVLGSVGGAKALATVRGAVGDSNAEVRTAAINALSDWPTADAAPELLALARSLGDAGEKLLCLRGVLRWAADSDVPAQQRLAYSQDAAGLIQRDEERKLLLAALGGINSPDAVAQILPFVDVATVREEACVAVVNIAERMAKSRNATKPTPGVISALEKVAQATASGDVAKRAKALLDANK